MKNIVIIVVFLGSLLSFGQQILPQLEEVNGLVKATYFYENGVVQQQGFFNEGKLDGKWISYDEKGDKKSIAEYSNGEKVGKWFFWNSNSLAEVDYAHNTITDIKNWSKESLADKN